MSYKYVILCTIILSALLTCKCVKFSSLDVVYNKGVDAYAKERWSECILQFEGSLHLYKVYKSIIINCRIKCKSESENHHILTENIEELKIFEYFLNMKDCLTECQQGGFEDAKLFSNASDTVLLNMQHKKPYAYLHLCYYQKNALHKAASAAYTYFVANTDDKRMQRNVEYYIQQPEVNIKEVNDLESEDYQILFKLGLQAYEKNKWGETIGNMEKTLTHYMTWENFCRADCEHQQDQELSSEFMVTISNIILPVLICRQKCQDKLHPLYKSGVEFLADVLNYLQISYYHMDRLEDAAKGVATYLFLHPTDEDMIENKRIYKTVVDENKFIQRSDIIHYFKRDTNEKQLLNFFLEKDNNIPNANVV